MFVAWKVFGFKDNSGCRWRQHGGTVLRHSRESRHVCSRIQSRSKYASVGCVLTCNSGLVVSIVATPGRFLHLVVEMELRLNSIEYVVFDEADR